MMERSEREVFVGIDGSERDCQVSIRPGKEKQKNFANTEEGRCSLVACIPGISNDGIVVTS